MSDQNKIEITVFEEDLELGLELEGVAYLMQKSRPDLIVTIINHTIIKIFQVNDFPIAYKLLNYDLRNEGIFHVEGIDGNGTIYTIFGISNMEKIFPGFVNNYPQCNSNRITIYLDGKYNDIPYYGKIIPEIKIKTGEIIHN